MEQLQAPGVPDVFEEKASNDGDAMATEGDTTPSKSSHVPQHGGAAPVQGVDYTLLPQLLDRKFEEFDEDSALRPTKISTGEVWAKRSQAGLISDVKTVQLREHEQRDEKTRAFDLLDALSRSGVLPCDHATLHVVLAATHCFTDSLVNTVVQGNVNPIEKVERSELIISSAIHNVAAVDLIAPAKVDGARLASSKLLA